MLVNYMFITRSVVHFYTFFLSLLRVPTSFMHILDIPMDEIYTSSYHNYLHMCHVFLHEGSLHKISFILWFYPSLVQYAMYIWLCKTCIYALSKQRVGACLLSKFIITLLPPYPIWDHSIFSI